MSATPHLAIVFFSATNNTRTIAETMGQALEQAGAAVDLLDITAKADRDAVANLDAYDAALFGFPVHSMRAPRVARDWLEGLNGQGMRCATFFTFGGFLVHPAHHSTRQLLEKRGFVVTASAEFPARHTFNLGGWQALANRPDQRETELARRYATALLPRLTGEDDTLPAAFETTDFTAEQLDMFESYRFKVLTRLPSRNGADCSLCGLCEEACPSGAMDAGSGNADPQSCIACLRCVDLCPEQALTINDMTPSWQPKLDMARKSAEELNARTGVLYL